MRLQVHNFYQGIIDAELLNTNYDEKSLEKAVHDILMSYSVSGLKVADSLNYNQGNLRCAYLQRFATSHTHMVLEALNRLHAERSWEIPRLVESAVGSRGSLNITSLGGGPGCDPIGVMAFLDQEGFLENCTLIQVNLIDKYKSWKSTFENVMQAYNNCFIRSYFRLQDILSPLSAEVMCVLRETHFLTMIKFVSAISGDDVRSSQSLQNIFSLLQPGAFVMIIDNAGGQDFNNALKLAKEMEMDPVNDPLQHYCFHVPKHLERGMGKVRFGVPPQTSSKISMVILKKRDLPANTFRGKTTESIDSPSTPPMPSFVQEGSRYISGFFQNAVGGNSSQPYRRFPGRPNRRRKRRNRRNNSPAAMYVIQQEGVEAEDEGQEDYEACCCIL